MDDDSGEWTTVEPVVERVTPNKKLNLHTESPISIYLKLKQIRKQLMANNSLNSGHHRPSHDRSEDRNDKRQPVGDQNSDASNLLKLSEAFTGGFSPLTTIPAHNRSSAALTDKEKYLSIINNSFKNQNINIVTVSPLPPNHKPLPSNSVHISSMDFGQWRPVSPLNHKSHLFSMFNSKNRPLNGTQPNKNSTNVGGNSQATSLSTTAKPKSSLKPVNPTLPPKSYTPPAMSQQHVHRPGPPNKNNFNQHLGHSPNQFPALSLNGNGRPPMGILNLRNDVSFGHRQSSSNNIQNTALPNGLMNNFNMNNMKLNGNNWLAQMNGQSRPPQMDPGSPLFGQPLSDPSLDAMFSFNNFNNPLETFDEIPSMLRREDTASGEQTTMLPPSFYRESRTNLKNKKNGDHKNAHLSKKEQIDLEALLGLTEFESLKLNSSNSPSDQNNNFPFFNQPMTTTSRPQSAVNRFQKRIGIVDREFIDQEYYKPLSTRRPVTSTAKPFEASRINVNEIGSLELSNLTISDDRLMKDKNLIKEDKKAASPTTLPSFNEDLRLNNFNDDIDLTGELPKFNGDGLIEMTTTLLRDESSSTSSLNNELNKTTTVSLATYEQTSTISSVATTTLPAGQVECDPFSEFACANGKQCVPKTVVCDHEINCADDGGSDELSCTCADYLTRFNQKRKICDGLLDCSDGSDELSCDYCKVSNSTEKNTLAEVFICPNTKKCIRRAQVCDGNIDCPLGQDEEFCVSLADEKEMRSLNSVTQKVSIKTYQNEGILVIRQNGVWAPLCLENSDVVSSLFGSSSSSSSSAYTSVGRSATDSRREPHELASRTNTKLFKGLSADTIHQSENGDLIVANSNIATLSSYSLSGNGNRNGQPQPRPWFEDDSSFNNYNFQLEELGRAVCSIQSFNELDSINVTSLARSKQLSDDEPAGDPHRLKYYSMNQPNKNTSKWGNLFRPDACHSGKIASIRCKEFGK